MTAPAQPKGRVAIVTGASSGIGEATAECLAGAGYSVVLAARTTSQLEAVAARIAGRGGCALVVPTDIADEHETRALVERTWEAFGRVDLLVNNAGFSLAAALEQLTRDDIRRTFEVNLLGGLQLIGLVTPIMREQGGGRIVNISSVAGSIPAPLAVPYAATKGALESATDCLRLELAPWNIHVALVVPGFVQTPVFDKAREWSQALRDDENNPYRKIMFDLDEFATAQLERAIRPVDVGRVIVEAASTARPKRRYFVPFSTRMQVGVMGSMPLGLRDQILSRIYKWR